MRVFLLLSAVLVAHVTMAQAQDHAPPPALVEPRVERNFGVHAGVNLGLVGIDLHVDNFYAYAAAGAGITLLTNNDFGAFAAGAGYSALLKRSTTGAWYMDSLFMTTPGWVSGGWPDMSSSGKHIGYLGVGAGLGFRYERDNGFSLGFKIPIFGYAFSSATNNHASQGVSLFYAASAAALPIISLGYRF